MSTTTLAPTRRSRGLALRRLSTEARRHPAATAAIAVLVVAATGLLATHHRPALALTPDRAISAMRADPAAGRILAQTRITRIQVLAMDRSYDQVVVYSGPRIVYLADVRVNGTVLATADLRHSSAAFGSGIANDPLVLALLCVVFVAMTAVWPLWRLRNLDVLVATSLVSSVVLFNDLLPVAMVLTTYPALIYLALRCAGRGLGIGRPAGQSNPLFEQLTSSWGFAQRRRVLRLIALASGLVVAMVGLSSLHVVDVGYAVMEGATSLVHGVLPYGQIPDVLHGDTYPLGSYLLYVPLALLKPVHNVWDGADLTLAVAVTATLLVAWWLCRSSRASEQHGADEHQAHELAGLRAAIAWLTFPTALVAVSTGTTDLVLAAFLAGAILLWRKPAASTTILAIGGWFKLAPVALLPLRLAPLRGRALVKALATIVAVSGPMIAVLLALGGPSALARMVDGMGFQQTRSSSHDIWTVIGPVPLQQFAQALTLALIVGAAVRLRSTPALACDRGRVAALTAAVLLSVQISANYWSSLYLTWVVPLLALSLVGHQCDRTSSGPPVRSQA